MRETGVIAVTLLLAGCRAEAPDKVGSGRDLDTGGADSAGDDSGGDSTGGECQTEEEIPYDGLDQDCDGTDLTDVDGDGWDAEASGGEDCDDADAAVYPGAPETRGDGVDQDCDDRIDEYVTCWDGSGDFETVQEGVDGTPDGGTLEICSGTYEEVVTIEDRVLTVEGDDPLGVLISASYTGDGSRPLTIEGEAEVTVRALGLEGTGYCLQAVTDTTPVAVDLVDFSRCRYAVGMDTASFGLSLTRSYFEDGGIALHGQSEMEKCVVKVTDAFGVGIAYDAVATISNNLLVGGSELYINLLAWPGMGSPELHLVNNTIADTDAFWIYVDADGSIPSPEAYLYNNIFANVRTVDGDEMPLWYVWWLDPNPSSYDVNPVAGYNLFPDDGGDLARVYEANTGEMDESLSSDAEVAIFTDGSRDDPEFSAGSMGNYGLASTSPAVDAGTGPADPDGSPADLGAFGGPNGAW